MEQTVNQITLCGTLAAAPRLSHESHGTRFFAFSLEVERLSGNRDVLPVLAPEAVLERCDPFGGDFLRVTGQIRSFNRRTPQGRRLLIHVCADSISVCSGPPVNDAALRGVLCKEPVLRRTPLGREICDVMLAVPRQYQRTDYIPCILWGRTAQCAAELPVGAQITLAGRLQSRGYVKVLPEGAEERTAYELSAMELEILEENF